MIALVDPGFRSTNTGDQIISDAVHTNWARPLQEQGVEINRVPMHGQLGDAERSILRSASEVVVTGTNLLSDHMRFRSAWEWDRSDIGLGRRKTTFFGVGWWQYQLLGIDPISARYLRDLQGGHKWAVRDNYSRAKLSRVGLAATHLSCPTLWTVDSQLLPSDQRRVVATFTDYNQDELSDKLLLRELAEKFDDVLLWPQGPGDREYLDSIRQGIGTFVGPSLTDFNSALSEESTAYVGLRLHGGIRAMQLGVPTLVIGIDNRAREIASSVGLVAPSRYQITKIRRLMNSGDSVPLRVPHSDIDDWLGNWTKVQQ